MLYLELKHIYSVIFGGVNISHSQANIDANTKNEYSYLDYFPDLAGRAEGWNLISL